MDAGLFGILVLVAVGIGFFASLLGVGGGIAIVPVLVLSGLAPSTQVAVGTSLAAVVATGAGSTYQYLRQRRIQVKLAFVLMPTLLLGVELGVRATEVLSSDRLAGIFGIFALYPAVVMLTGKKTGELVQGRTAASPGEIEEALHRPWTVWEALGVGLVSGTAAGLFGIGGGAIMVPAMVLVLRVPMLEAVATSLFAMVPNAAFGAFRHWTLGNLDVALAVPIILGVLVGAQIGPVVAARLPQRRLRQAFGVVLIYAAANLIAVGFF